MSSFLCEKCGTAIIDTPRTAKDPGGYVTGCEHYPISPQMKKAQTLLANIHQKALMKKEMVDSQNGSTKPHNPPANLEGIRSKLADSVEIEYEGKEYSVRKGLVVSPRIKGSDAGKTMIIGYWHPEDRTREALRAAIILLEKELKRITTNDDGI